MIEVELDSGTAILRMKHGKVNAMDLKFCQALTAVLEQVEAADIRAAILVGNDRVFSAGVDLPALIAGGASYRKKFLPALVTSFKSIFNFPKPIVAAINGHAVAGGCILAAACDRRLIHSKARIGIPELRVGVPLPSICIEIMRFVAAPEALQAMVNVGRTYRNDEAVRVGLADSVVNEQKLMARAYAEIESLLAIPESVFAVTKKQLRAPVNRMVLQNEAQFDETVFELWDSDPIQKVIREYIANHL